jgi:DNA-binding transcriptional ArsR family regulator
MSLFGDMLSQRLTDTVWKALADPRRRAVLDLLSDGPRSTGEICDAFSRKKQSGLCRTAVMKHLDLLVAARLVIVRREGRVRWNHLNPVPIQEVCDRWVSRHVRDLASAMTRLRDHVEEPTST